MKITKKRILSIFVAVLMLISLLPTTAIAVGTECEHDWGEWTFNKDGTHTRVCKTDSTHIENGNCAELEWTYDSNGHSGRWLCNVCNGGLDKNSVDYPEHIYSGDTDLTCDTCGYVRSVEGSLSITGDLPAATVGVAYSASLSYTGEVSGVVFWNATGLPAGLTVDYGTGTISGTPTTAGTYEVTVSMGATGGGSASKNFTLTVNAEHTHVWSDDWSSSQNYHWHDCTAEGCNLNPTTGTNKDGYATHEFEIIRDTHSFIDPIGFGFHYGTCVECGRSDSEIIIATTRQFNDTHHWYECPCGVIGWDEFRDKVEHSFDDDADMLCDTCGYDRTPKHEHVWSTEWSGNDWSHWHDCTADGCDLPDNTGGNKAGFGYHEFDFAGSTHVNCVGSKNVLHKGTCLTCGETEALKYFEEATIKSDETHHWYECSCGVTEWMQYFEKGEHSFDDDADTTCDDCGYVRTVGGGTTVNGVITLTPADLENGEASGEGWSFNGTLTIESGYTLVFDGDCEVQIKNNGTIKSGIFHYLYENDGFIEGGTFVNICKNNNTISGGTFLNGVTNVSLIKGGTFNNDVGNHGTIEGGSFSAYVDNFGTIEGGSFNGTVTNYDTIESGTFDGEVSNLGTITGGTFNHEVFNSSLISGGTFTKQVTNDGTIENGIFDWHVANNDHGTIIGGNFNLNSFVENRGTIEGGNFSGSVSNYNNATISGGIFTRYLLNDSTVTGTADLSTLDDFDDYGGQYGKDVKLPKAVMKGELTYTGCESSTEITLEYYADGVKTAEWTVSGERYSFPVEKYRRTDPAAELSAIEEISHKVEAVSMDGYEITIDNPIWDRFHVTVTRTSPDLTITGISDGDSFHVGTKISFQALAYGFGGAPYFDGDLAYLPMTWVVTDASSEEVASGDWFINDPLPDSENWYNQYKTISTDAFAEGRYTLAVKWKIYKFVNGDWIEQNGDATDTVEVEFSLTHSYGTEWKSDVTNHWHECSCGAKSGEAAHSGGTVTCTEKAVCTTCDQPYGEVLGHDWGNWISNGDGTHTRTCANDANHTETNDCSGGAATCTEKAKCTVCGTEYGNLAEHTYGTEWKSDGTNHWHECACGAKTEEAAHSGGTATCTEKAKCTACGTEYGNLAEHTYGTEWKSDGTNHWHECSCGAKSGEAAHSGGTATCTEKAKCTACGTEYGNLAEHTYGTEWKSDGTNHWHECSCGAKTEEAAHTYGNWKVVKKATTTAKGKEERTCSACGHVESRDIPMISDVPQTGDESNLLMWGTLMGISVLGMVVLLVENKRRRFTK